MIWLYFSLFLNFALAFVCFSQQQIMVSYRRQLVRSQEKYAELWDRTVTRTRTKLWSKPDDDAAPGA